MSVDLTMKVSEMKKNIVEKENEKPKVIYTLKARTIEGQEPAKISLEQKDVPFEFESGQLITVTVEGIKEVFLC